MLATRNRIPTKVRQEVYRRDENMCILCLGALSQVVHLHHVVKRSQGGTNEPSNLVCLCPICHAIAHGEYQLKNQFPFKRETAQDAITHYLEYSTSDGYPF